LPFLRLFGIRSDGCTAANELFGDVTCAKSVFSHPFAQLHDTHGEFKSTTADDRTCHDPSIFKQLASYQR